MHVLAMETQGWFSGWLTAQPGVVLWLLCVGGIVALVLGADKTVGSAVALAGSLGMSTVIVGATVVSLGTTAPEMFTSVTAAFRGESGFALGNAVGSIICDTGLIFGLGCLLTRLPLDRFVLNRHGWLQLGAGVLLAATCGGLALAAGRIGLFGEANSETWNVIPRWVGAGFTALLAGYLYLSVRWARQRPEISIEAVDASMEPLTPPRPARRTAMRSLGILLLGLALVAAGANVLIPSASVLALRYGVPKDFLAVTLVAFGTSLPELVTAIAAIAKGHKGLLVGNIIGADILNVLFVVGLSACASELKIPPTFYVLHLPVMLVALILLRVYILTGSGGTFRRWQGLPLVLLYVGYIAAVMILGPKFE